MEGGVARCGTRPLCPSIRGGRHHSSAQRHARCTGKRVPVLGCRGDYQKARKGRALQARTVTNQQRDTGTGPNASRTISRPRSFISARTSLWSSIPLPSASRRSNIAAMGIFFLLRRRISCASGATGPGCPRDREQALGRVTASSASWCLASSCWSGHGLQQSPSCHQPPRAGARLRSGRCAPLCADAHWPRQGARGAK